MPHIDEGVLHACLDGALDALSDAGELPDGMTGADVLAHLRSCADCAARLETERALREGAGAIMRDAAPAVIEPPGLPAEPGRHRRQWVPLAWAASLLLAAGAGWWSSAILRSPEYAEVGAVREVPSTDGAQPGLSDEIAPLRSEAQQSDVDAAEQSAAARGRAAADEDRRERRAADGTPLAADASAANVATTPAAPPPAAAAPVREPEVARAAPSPPAPAARSFVQTDSVARQQRDAAAAGLAQSIVVTGSAERALEDVLARERAGTLAMETVGRAERGARAAGAWIIRDAAITEVAVGEVEGQRLVRVRQRLSGADPIDVITWLPQPPAAVAGLEMSKAAEARATQEAVAGPSFSVVPGWPRLLVDGRRELRLQASDAPLRIVIRADVASDQLASLASRLERLPR